MNGVFNKGLEEIATETIHKGGVVLPFHKPLLEKAYAELFEQLLLFDKVSIVLTPFNNKPIAALLNRFSLDDLLRALALESIELVLPRTMAVSGLGPFGKGKDNPELLKGQPPVVVGIIQDGLSPEIAVLDALNYTNKYIGKDSKSIVNEIAKYIKRGSLTDSNEANRIVMGAYESDSFASTGMPFIGDAYNFDALDRSKYQRLVSEVEDLLFVAENNYGMYQIPSVYTVAMATVGNIEDALNVQRSNDKLLNETALPNLRTLYSSGKASFKTAMELRETPENIEFRRWIYNISDPAERDYVIRKYAAAIAKPTGFSESTLGKFSKGLAMYGPGQLVSTGAGLAVTAALGATPFGFAAGTLTTGMLKAVFEVTGNLFLDKMASYISKGWTPLQFVERIQIIAEGNK